jgi:hypothetical protein
MEHTEEQSDKTIPVQIVGDLAAAFGKSISTIYRWVKSKDDRLTSDKAKKVYAEHGFVWKASEVLDGQLAG